MSTEYATQGNLEQQDFDVSIEPESSHAWLNLIEDAEKALKDYQEYCDSIDKKYADLRKLAAATVGDREFQLFWANIQVLGPSIYSRPPVPVVVPRFRNRKPVPRTASELLERSAVVMFELEDIDGTMRLVRDDLTRLARGCVWIRYEAKEKKKKKAERVCIEHVDRRDWLCAPARKWQEVPWVAKRSWLSKEQMKDRFKGNSGDAYLGASYEDNDREQKDRGNRDPILKAGVWEIWHKDEDRVVWVTVGVGEVLDSSEPHLDLEGFFPCPRPAYATVQPGSLVPVPDYVYYKDQISEINELTARISALSDSLRMKGFYPGGGEIGDAIEAAMKRSDNETIMVPIANWAAFGGSGEQIIWLPIDMVATTIAGLVELRKQLIDDVYQITGLSDIMRGSTDANETLGAQELKSQYGSVRVRDRQDELVRVARDTTRIVCEIMAENFGQKTLEDMSQLELPTDAEIKKQIKEIEDKGKELIKGVEKQVRDARANPQMMAQAKQDPEQAQQMIQQVQQQAQQQLQQMQGEIKKIGETVTIEQVMELLKEQRMRPFVLDIETDSTIAPDENAQKQRATEFITAVGGYMSQSFPLVQAMPQAATLVADTLKYVASQFRAGRELDNTIDEFAETMKSMAAQPQANPEAEKAKADQAMEQQRMQFEAQKLEKEQELKTQELQMKGQMEGQRLQADMQMKQQEAQASQQENQAKLQMIAAQMQRDEQKGALEMQKLQMEIEAKQAELQIKAQSAQIDAAMQVQNAEIQASQATQQANQSERSFEQQTQLNAQKAKSSGE